MFTFVFKGTLLEYKEGTFQGNDYTSVKIRSNEIAENSILKYKVDAKSTGKFGELLDKECEFTVTIASGQNSSATLKITHVELA